MGKSQRALNIFVLEHCYAAVAARTERLPTRNGGHRYTFYLGQ